MRLNLFFTVPQVDAALLPGSAAIVIDVIRATSSMVEALANGARSIFPVLETEEAIHLANSLGREDTLLCGERKGLKVEGFDLGNSPREFTPESVAGKQLVMTTTNGTRAFLAAAEADKIVAASFLNLEAVAEAVRGYESVVIVCAGKENRFSMDDAVCGGVLVGLLSDGVPGVESNDSARAARMLSEGVKIGPDFLSRTAAGAALLDIGLADDLPFCAERDRHALAPEMKDRVIRLPS